ncbi:MAG TPA: hypothetical protein VJ044_08465, partial [Candidatus Hodarchaeales archaeon]|nr:hypothetical protein [Candidatus Hodarchaeales archaeon]
SDLKSAQREVEDSTICKWDKGLLIPYTNKTTGKGEFSVTRNADISLNNAAAMRIIPYEAIPTIKTEALKRFSESIDLHEVKFSALECTFCHRITAKEVGPRIPSSLEKRSADIAYEILDSSGSRENLFRNPLPPVRKTVSYLKLFLLFRQSHYSKIVNDPDTSRIVTVVLLTSAFVNSLSSDIATLNGLAIFIWNFLSLCALLWIFTIVVYRFNIASAKDVSHDVIFRIIGLSHAFNIPLYFLVVLGTLMGFINSSLGGIFLPGMSIYFFEGFIFVHVLSTLLRDQLTKSPSWSFIWVSILLIVLQGLIFMLFGAVLVLSLFVWVF